MGRHCKLRHRKSVELRRRPARRTRQHSSTATRRRCRCGPPRGSRAQEGIAREAQAHATHVSAVRVKRCSPLPPSLSPLPHTGSSDRVGDAASGGKLSCQERHKVCGGQVCSSGHASLAPNCSHERRCLHKAGVGWREEWVSESHGHSESTRLCNAPHRHDHSQDMEDRTARHALQQLALSVRAYEGGVRGGQPCTHGGLDREKHDRAAAVF